MPTKLVAAIAATLFAGSAAAVSLNPRGLGQALIYPYYTVNKQQDTLLSVVNTGDTGKAVKVRFLEGYNGRPALEFLVFLAPHDTWVGAVSAIDPADPASGAKLVTNDNSCTDQPSKEMPFVPQGFDGNSPDFPADDGPQDVARVREGSFEIITLGDVVRGSTTERRISPSRSASGDYVPPDCEHLDVDAALTGLVAPTNALMGSTMIVNAGDGIFYSYNASALAGFTDRALTPPEDTLAQANSNASTLDGAVATVYTDDGTPLTVDYADGIDAVSAVFMADALYNEFLTASSMGASTDWVVTFPTKAFYVDKRLYPTSFTSPFIASFANSVSRVTTDFFQTGRESDPQPTYGCDGGSPNCEFPHDLLRYQVNVVSFLTDPPAGTPSGVLGSRLTANAKPFRAEGWMQIDLASGDGGHDLNRGQLPDGSSVSLRGLPATGFMAYNVINTQAQPGKLSNYSGTFAHRSSTACIGNIGPCL